MKNICNFKCRLSISWYVVGITSFILLQQCSRPGDFSLRDTDLRMEITTKYYILDIEKAGFRYAFLRPDGTVIAPAHNESGLLIGHADSDYFGVESTELIEKGEAYVRLKVRTTKGTPAVVTLWPDQHAVKMEVRPESEGDNTIVARTGAVGPAYGMADHAAFGEGKEDLQLRNFVRDPLVGYRMISNLVICPQQGFAAVNMEPGTK